MKAWEGKDQIDQSSRPLHLMCFENQQVRCQMQSYMMIEILQILHQLKWFWSLELEILKSKQREHLIIESKMKILTLMTSNLQLERSIA